MKTVYTQGSWQLCQQEDGRQQIVAQGVPIAELLTCDCTAEESLANGHLLASAPELLETAIRMESYITQYIGNGYADAGVVSLRNAARLIIKQAKGE